MKKFLFALFLLLVTSAGLLAQALPSEPSLFESRYRGFEATYDFVFSKGAPKSTVTLNAALKNSDDLIYEVTVTLQNNSDEVLKSWNLALFLCGTVTGCSSNVTDYAHFFSDGPALGYIGFAPCVDQVDGDGNFISRDLGPHESFTFTYSYQLPSSLILQAPAKVILSHALSYVGVREIPPMDQ